MTNWEKTWRQKNPGLKPCTRCCKPLLLSDKSRCDNCRKIYNAIGKKWYWAHRNEALAKFKQWATKLRKDVMEAYGCKCNHCDETNPFVLQLDHVNNDGYNERKEIKGTLAIYRKVRRLGYPKDRYQLLCANCNWCKGIWGFYPDGEVP